MRKLVFTLAILLTSVAAFADATSWTHSYDLTSGSAADSKGGPSLTLIGGSLGASGFAFGPGGGASLSGAIGNPTNYSIEVVFTLNSVAGWQEIINYKNFTTGQGLWNHDGNGNFWSFTGDSASAWFAAGQDIDLIATRDASGVAAFYVNNQLVLTFTDFTLWQQTVLSGPGNIIQLFQDGGAGTLKRVNIFEGALNQAQVVLVDADGNPGAIALTPEPGSLALLGTGVGCMLWGRRRRASQ